jgi:hypothetical protein
MSLAAIILRLSSCPLSGTGPTQKQSATARNRANSGLGIAMGDPHPMDVDASLCIQDLPEEVFILIFGNLDAADLCRVGRVCSEVREYQQQYYFHFSESYYDTY